MSIKTSNTDSRILKKFFGETKNGEEIFIYKLSNRLGASVEIINYGSTVVSINVPDRKGHIDNVTLGFDCLNEYERQIEYFGSTIGRFANRIANGKFTLNDQTYHLSQNDNGNTLHGGHNGFDSKAWAADVIFDKTDHPILHLKTSNFDGENGFPGLVEAEVIYRFDNENQLTIDYKAKSNAPTIINLTNHCYFNLNGHGSNDATDHYLQINSQHYTPLNTDMVPTGNIQPVQGTSFDFSVSKKIAANIDDACEQIVLANGFDHNWVLKNQNCDKILHAATLYSPQTGRTLDVFTDHTGIQFYSGNHIQEQAFPRAKALHGPRSGICLEAQGFPDSPNHINFPTNTLNPDEIYRRRIIYKFDIR